MSNIENASADRTLQSNNCSRCDRLPIPTLASSTFVRSASSRACSSVLKPRSHSYPGYTVRFERWRSFPAYHLRSPVQVQESLKLEVEEPPSIVAETLRSLLRGPLMPHPVYIEWDTLIVLHRIYLFASERREIFPHDPDEVPPFDPSRLPRAFDHARSPQTDMNRVLVQTGSPPTICTHYYRAVCAI